MNIDDEFSRDFNHMPVARLREELRSAVAARRELMASKRNLTDDDRTRIGNLQRRIKAIEGRLASIGVANGAVRVSFTTEEMEWIKAKKRSEESHGAFLHRMVATAMRIDETGK